MAFLGNLGKYRNFGLLIIRVGLGIMFIYHGYPKLAGGPKDWAHIGSATKYVGITFAPVFWGLMTAVVETFGGFLLIIGWAFRAVCLLLLINMIVAAMFHIGSGQGLQMAAHAIEDGIVFLGLIFVGPGSYSADKK